jgi:hypothetical protein
VIANQIHLAAKITVKEENLEVYHNTVK